jgi:dCMP deaminase
MSASTWRTAPIYVPLFPCNECSKAIIQSGIREVVYISDKYAQTDSVRASKRMLDHAGVLYRRLETRLETLALSYRAGDI